MEVGCIDYITDRQCVGDRIDGNDCDWSERFDRCCCLPWDAMNFIIIFPFNNLITNTELESLETFFCGATDTIAQQNDATRFGLIAYNTESRILLDISNETSHNLTFGDESWSCSNWFPSDINDFLNKTGATNQNSNDSNIYSALLDANEMIGNINATINTNPNVILMVSNEKWNDYDSGPLKVCNYLDTMIFEDEINLLMMHTSNAHNNYSCLDGLINPNLFINITSINDDNLADSYQIIAERLCALPLEGTTSTSSSASSTNAPHSTTMGPTIKDLNNTNAIVNDYNSSETSLETTLTIISNTDSTGTRTITSTTKTNEIATSPTSLLTTRDATQTLTNSVTDS